MASKITNTGERLLADASNHFTAIEHLHRYALAREVCKGKVILDIASGEGYGSNLLAEVASYVYGVDNAEEVIEHARSKYIKENIEFIQGSADQIPLKSNSVDVVVSFETLEHHDKHDEMFSEIKRILKEDGLLILSTPDSIVYTGSIRGSQFHVKEIGRHELINLASKYFQYLEVFEQKIIIGSMIKCIGSAQTTYQEYHGNFQETRVGLGEDPFFNKPFFNILLASNQPLKGDLLAGLSLYDGHIVYKELLERSNTHLQKVLNSSSYKLGQSIINPVKSIIRWISRSRK